MTTTKEPIRKDQFMTVVQNWRRGTSQPQQAYIAAIPKHVADSMAFEGEPVSQKLLEEHLSRI